MAEKEYIYDAFISYRHTELDKYVAETLHKRMESFKLPRNISKTSLKRDSIKRVFRDRDELPLASNLEDPIIEALGNSEYLIVICSPRLKESIWCKKEIQTFIEMNGRRKILAVLVEGEPDESFPEELLYDEQEIIDENGNKSTIRKPIEPLAADFRGKNKTEIDRAMKNEILRLLAPMFGLGYDDLKQRHREQKVRKIITISAVSAIAGLAIGAYSTATALKISRQAEQLAINQSQLLINDALQLSEDDDRKASIQTAYMALTEYEGIKMPATPEAETALAECLSVYEGGNIPKAVFQIELPGVVESFEISPDGNKIITNDNLGNLSIMSIADKEIIASISDKSSVVCYGFIDDNYFFYLSSEGILNKVEISSGKTQTFSDDEFLAIDNVKISSSGSLFIVSSFSKCALVDADSLAILHIFDALDTTFDSEIFIDDTANLICIEQRKNETEYYLCGYDINTYEQIFQIPVEGESVEDIKCTDDKIYILDLAVKNIFSGATNITAFDRKQGKIVYKKEYSGLYGQNINLLPTDHILITGFSNAVLINDKDGTEIEKYDTEDEILYVNSFDSGSFGIYTSNGAYHSIDTADPVNDMVMDGICCKDLIKLDLATGYFAGIKENDNRIIFYSYLKNGDSTIYNQNINEPYLAGEIGEKAIALAQQFGIEKASFVKSYLDIEEANLIIISYFNDCIQIYKKDNKNLLSEYFDISSGNIEYYGRIKDYNIIEINYIGYLIDDLGKIHAKIKDLAGISDDNKCVVVYGKDDDRNNAMIAIPVYTQGEILDKANRFLSR